MKKRIILTGLLLAVIFFPLSSYATINLIGDVANSASGLGNFTGSFTYTPLSSSTATIDISLTNTTNPSYDGSITAFAFNNPFFDHPTNYIETSTLTSKSNSFFYSLGMTDDGVNAESWGYFDMGGSLSSSNFLGGGNENNGIGVGPTGNTATFTFTLTGSLGSLTESDFRNTFSQNGNRSAWFLVRFRGIEYGVVGSDQVPSDGNIIPEPITILLFGAGILGFGVFKRRKR